MEAWRQQRTPQLNAGQLLLECFLVAADTKAEGDCEPKAITSGGLQLCVRVCMSTARTRLPACLLQSQSSACSIGGVRLALLECR